MKHAFEAARRNTRAEKRRIVAKPKTAMAGFWQHDPNVAPVDLTDSELALVAIHMRDKHRDAGQRDPIPQQARPNSKLCRPSYGADREKLFSKTPHGVKLRELVKVEARADADWLAHQRAEQQAMAQRLILESWACAFLFPPRSHFL